MPVIYVKAEKLGLESFQKFDEQHTKELHIDLLGKVSSGTVSNHVLGGGGLELNVDEIDARLGKRSLLTHSTVPNIWRLAALYS